MHDTQRLRQATITTLQVAAVLTTVGAVATVALLAASYVTWTMLMIALAATAGWVVGRIGRDEDRKAADEAWRRRDRVVAANQVIARQLRLARIPPLGLPPTRRRGGWVPGWEARLRASGAREQER